jgi:hypothetical protein
MVLLKYLVESMGDGKEYAQQVHKDKRVKKCVIMLM